MQLSLEWLGCATGVVQQVCKLERSCKKENPSILIAYMAWCEPLSASESLRLGSCKDNVVDNFSFTSDITETFKKAGWE